MKTSRKQARKGPRILIVDDDASIRLGLSQILVAEGYQVNTAASLDRICHIAATLCPDVVLMDLVLPGANGFEGMEMLQRDPRTSTIPVIAMTASWLGSRQDRLESVGFSGALRKPFSGSSMCDEIQRVYHAANGKMLNALHLAESASPFAPPLRPFRRS